MDIWPAKQRSACMRRIRSKDTGPELAVRRLVFSLGYSYRLHSVYLPGKPDLVFPSRRKAIFVHGCFWHQHKGCIDGHVPKSRKAYWTPKLKRTAIRDKRNLSELNRLGWECLVIWECSIKRPKTLASRIRRFLDS